MGAGATETIPKGMKLIATGTKIWSSGGAVQLPDIPCRVVFIKALAGNGGVVAVGISTITVPSAANSTTAGYELSAGDPFPVTSVKANLNELYLHSATASAGICYACYG